METQITNEAPTIARQKFTKLDKFEIDFLQSTGYGWGKFAESVKAQGWISPKQRATIHRMTLHIQNKNRMYAANSRLYQFMDDDIESGGEIRAPWEFEYYKAGLY